MASVVAVNKANDRYSDLRRHSVSARLTLYMRQRMFTAFMAAAGSDPEHTVLDVGTTSDQLFEDSNYFESWYPYKDRITALGYTDARFLTARYPGLSFVRGDGRWLPFADNSFDAVHSSAVIEHVGNLAHQAQFLRECVRVSCSTVFLATPDRAFPIELHTALPLLHWLPPALYRRVLRLIGKAFYAEESNLNLLSRGALAALLNDLPNVTWRFIAMRLGGWNSNLVVVITKNLTP